MAREGIDVFSERGNIMFSETGEMIITQKVRKHNTRKPPTIEIFDKLKEFCVDDNFWSEKLTSFSRNIFPKQFKFIGNKLVYKATAKKTKEELTLEGDDYPALLSNLKEFLKNKGIFSKEDEKVNQIEVLKQMGEFAEPINSWKQAENAKMKIPMIHDYIIFLKDRYKLNEEEIMNLRSVINIGLESDFFHEGNIDIENDKIISFDGLVWDEEKREFLIDKRGGARIKKSTKKKKIERDIYTYDTEISKNEENYDYTKEDLMKKWEKMLKSIREKRIEFNKYMKKR